MIAESFGVYIEGVTIGGFRSLGEPQRLGPLQKVNLLIGPNNSGKSNILLWLKNYFGKLVSKAEGRRSALDFSFSDIDHHLGDKTFPLVFGLALYAEGSAFAKLAEKEPSMSECLKKLLYSQTLSGGTGFAWFEYEITKPQNELNLSSTLVESLVAEKVFPFARWEQIFQTLTKRRTEDHAKNTWILGTLHAISPANFSYPKVSFVPAIRRISETSGSDDKTDDQDLSGTGLIDRLARLEKPTYNQQPEKQRFESINKFLRSVTENASATLEIPYKRDMIIVHMDGKSLPLTSLGTGIHEVIILAAAATVVENQIVCMEEPELHLHPVLQRKLIRYLIENTSNQYFITTHSAHLLEAEDATIIRIKLENGQTKATVSSTAPDKWEICRDLGYRASDILQTNCVIWVEGPSDRIYLNHWINAVDSNLVEGIHYSIMFYGGRLLRHLTANDPEIDEFISLRRLNRNIVVIADSDKDSSHKHINDTKKRIRDEFEEGSGFAWITKGREIENYIDSQTLRDAVEEVKPGMGDEVVNDPYSRALPFVNPKAKNPVTVDKVKVAHAVANRTAQLDVLDLKQQIHRLVDFINGSNA